MGYENIDEASRREACERVKQIVKAIKAIKIKYYLNFSKISAEDKEKYQNLETNLEKISEQHNLKNLKETLMSEVDVKYGSGNKQNPYDLLQACYGAIDAEVEALSKGKITQAFRCQEQLKRYKQLIDLKEHKDMILNYKRKKFAQLGITMEQVEEQRHSWENKMKGMFKIKHVSKRDDVVRLVSDVQNPEKVEERTEEIVI